MVFIKKCRAWYEFLPTIFWQSLMSGSFVYQYSSFSESFRDHQAFGIGVFSISIFVSDWLMVPKLNLVKSKYELSWLYIGYFLAIVSVVFQLSHLYLMPEIPLITVLQDHWWRLWTWFETGQYIQIRPIEQAEKYMKLRESSSKLLDVPLLYIYLCQATLLVFAPLSIHILVKAKKWFLAIMFLSFCLFYSRASLAKGTLYLFLALMVLQLWFLLSAKMRQKFVYLFGGAGILVGGYCAFVLTTHPSSIFVYKAPDVVLQKYYKRLEKKPNAPKILTNADHGRLFENSLAERALSPIEKFINFFAYRVFFVPSEVSHFWYMYYPKEYGEYLGFYGLSPSTRRSKDFVHPANRLGRWAYLSRFPDHYFASVRAYCSIDADAHSRWGKIGVLLIALLLLLMRVLWKSLRIEGRVGSAFYASLLFVLGSALPAASFFAIVSANGVFLYFAMILALSFFKLND